MPVTKSAIKKWRKDKKRTLENDAFRSKLRAAMRAAKKSQSQDTLSSAFSFIDKATKKHLLHANKAARMKAALTRTAIHADAPVKPTKATKPATKKRTPKAKVQTA